MKRNSLQKGFTLIELLVVIAIISLLSSIVMASLSSAKQKAQTTKILQEIKQFQNAMEQYRLSNGKYYDTVTYAYSQQPENGPDNMTPFVNVMKPYMKIDKLFFTQIDVNFHLNYLGDGTCEGRVVTSDSYSVIFYTPLSLPALSNWKAGNGATTGYYCFMNI